MHEKANSPRGGGAKPRTSSTKPPEGAIVAGTRTSYDGKPPQGDALRFDDHLRRISVALFAAGIVVVLLVANLGPAGLNYSVNRGALNLVAAAAGLAILGVLFFPWRRYDRNLFVVAALSGMCLIALAVYFSGGWESPLAPLYYFVVGFAVIYFSPRVAAAVVFLTALLSLSPQLYDPDAAHLVEHMMVSFPSYLALALVSGYMAREIGRKERQRGEYERELKEARELGERFRRDALTDHLTGLLNRRQGEKRLAEEAARVGGGERLLTLGVVDVNKFKQINDTYGHQVGDACIRHVANVIRRNIRQSDWLARWGGDEFIVALHDSSPFASPELVLQRIVHDVKDSPFRLPQGEKLTLSVTVGASRYSGEDDLRDLLARADEAMYEAKRHGRPWVLSV